MSIDITHKRFDEMQRGVGGLFVRVRAELGVTAFGLQLLELPAHFVEAFAEHDHASEPVQEEVYVPLSGRGTLLVDDERIELAPGMAVRVGPAQRRRVVTDGETLRYLAIGGTPGAAYTPVAISELDA